MHIRSLGFLLIILSLVAIAQGGAAAIPARAAAPPAAALAYADGAMLIENVGQFPDYILFQALGANGQFFVGRDSLWLPGARANAPAPASARPYIQSKRDTTWVQVRFAGSSGAARVTPFAPLATEVAYFYGQDAAQWHAHVPTWGGLRLSELYPGVDLVLDTTGGRLTPLLEAAPGADLSRVALELPAGTTVQLSAATAELQFGAMHAQLPLLTVADQPGGTSPLRAQVDGQLLRRPFVTQAPLAYGADISFGFYRTIMGNQNDVVNNLEVDQDLTYFVGDTASLDMPVTAPISGTFAGGGTDAIFGKLSPQGQFMTLSFWGGKGYDTAYGLHIDKRNVTNDLLIVGYTNSSDYPATVGDTSVAPSGNCTYPTGVANCYDLFISRFSNDGQVMKAGTLQGSSKDEFGLDVVTDPVSGIVYVSGSTFSPDFTMPQTAADLTMAGPSEGIVLRFTSSLSIRESATFYGGSGSDDIFGIDIDASQRLYISGYTTSGDLPGLNGFDTTYNGGGDGYMARLSMNMDTILYSTYVGGSGSEFPYRLFLANPEQANPTAAIVGSTGSSDFPTTVNGYSRTLKGSRDGFLIGITPDGSTPLYSTYIGGNNDDFIYSLERSDAGVYYVGGETTSTNLPTTIDAQLAFNPFGVTGFIFVFDPSNNKVKYSSYLGKDQRTRVLDLALGSTGLVYGAGTLNGSDGLIFKLRTAKRSILLAPIMRR